MFKLSGVAAFGITQWRVRVDQPDVTQVFQGHEVLGFTEAIQPATTESQGAEVFVDHIQQMFSLRQPGVHYNRKQIDLNVHIYG